MKILREKEPPFSYSIITERRQSSNKGVWIIGSVLLFFIVIILALVIW